MVGGPAIDVTKEDRLGQTGGWRLFPESRLLGVEFKVVKAVRSPPSVLFLSRTTRAVLLSCLPDRQTIVDLGWFGWRQGIDRRGEEAGGRGLGPANCIEPPARYRSPYLIGPGNFG